MNAKKCNDVTSLLPFIDLRNLYIYIHILSLYFVAFITFYSFYLLYMYIYLNMILRSSICTLYQALMTFDLAIVTNLVFTRQTAKIHMFELLNNKICMCSEAAALRCHSITSTYSKQRISYSFAFFSFVKTSDRY